MPALLNHTEHELLRSPSSVVGGAGDWEHRVTGYPFQAHVGVRVQPPASCITEFVRVRHAVPVAMARLRGEECPLAATFLAPPRGRRVAPVRLRRMGGGFYVEVPGLRNEPLNEAAFSDLVARSGTMGSRSVVTWPSNPFGDPPAYGPDQYPALRPGSDGCGAAAEKAQRLASALVSIDGIVHARRSPPGWRLGDEGGTYAVRPLIPGGAPERHHFVSGREISSYWVDVPFDRRDALDEILAGGRLVVASEAAGRVPVPASPVVEWTDRPFGSCLAANVLAADAIARLRAASPWLSPENARAAVAWKELRAIGEGVPDPVHAAELLSAIAKRERRGPNPTLGTAAWLELTWLTAMGGVR